MCKIPSGSFDVSKTNSTQPLMILYHPVWHCFEGTNDIRGIYGLVGRVGHQRTHWDPYY